MYNSTPHRVTGLSPYILLYGREPILPVDQLLSNTESDWGEDYVQVQANIIKKASQLAISRMKASCDRDKMRYDKKAKAKPLEVGDNVLLKQCAFLNRHKLENQYKEQKYVVVSMNTEGDVYTIRPSRGGPELTVNRKLLIIDPRGIEPDDEGPVLWLDDSSSDVDSSSSEEETFPMWWTLEAKPSESPMRVPKGEKQSNPVAPRRSQRANKGVHNNPAHWPVSVTKK